MAIFKYTKEIPLCDRWSIFVVREDRNREVIMSLVEKGDSPMKARIAIDLSLPKARELAKALVGAGDIELFSQNLDDDA